MWSGVSVWQPWYCQPLESLAPITGWVGVQVGLVVVEEVEVSVVVLEVVVLEVVVLEVVVLEVVVLEVVVLGVVVLDVVVLDVVVLDVVVLEIVVLGCSSVRQNCTDDGEHTSLMTSPRSWKMS